MSWLSELREQPEQRRWSRVVLGAVLLTVVPSVLAVGLDLIRYHLPEGIPLIADTDYLDEILVPCPENTLEATAIVVDDLPDRMSQLTFVDARTAGEFLAGHIPGAINIPHRTIGADDAAYQAAIERDLASLRGVSGEQIVVCGDHRIGSGRDFASVLLESGFSGVRYIDGGCEAWVTAGRSLEGQQEGVVMVTADQLSPDLQGLTVVDARFSRYYRRGHLPGAIAVPYRMLEGQQDDRLDPIRDVPGTSILVYGSESRGEGEDLARLLVAGGWSGARYLEGGFEAWEAAGYRIEEGEGQEGTQP